MNKVKKLIFFTVIAICLSAFLNTQAHAAGASDFSINGSTLTQYIGTGGDVSIPGNLGITEIGTWAFANSNVTSVVIPDGVTTIKSEAFYNCASLRTVSIPDSVTSIGVQAFMQCYNLTSITLPPGIKTIGINTFANCQNLTSINIPDGVTLIDIDAFYCCFKLTSLSIPDSVLTIGDRAFEACRSLATITLPKYITSISPGMLKSCNLTAVQIPTGVTTIGNGSFSYNFNLQNLVIPNNVTSIGERAFYLSQNLTSITIPESVTYIGPDAFYAHNAALKIYGYAGSYAQQYAATQGIPFTILPSTAVTGISLNKTNLRLKVDDLDILYATISPSNATNQKIVWSSSDESIATVYDGLVAARRPGVVKIKATSASNNNIYAECSLEVYDPDLLDKNDDLKMECFALSELSYTTFSTYQLDKKINDPDIIEEHKRIVNARNKGELDYIWAGKDVTYSDWFLNTVGKWKLKGYSYDDGTGFYASAFVNDERKILVVAYRGTSGSDDWLTDAKFGVISTLDSQFSEALNFFNQITNLYNGSGYSVMLTGHSLGGALATYIALETGYPAQVFDAPSIAEIVVTKYAALSNFKLIDWKNINITNDVNEHDNVGNQGSKILETTIKHECKDPTIYGGITNTQRGLHFHLNLVFPDESHNFYTILQENNGSFDFTPVKNPVIGPVANFNGTCLQYDTSVVIWDKLVFGTKDRDVIDLSLNNSNLRNFIYGGDNDDFIHGGFGDDVVSGGKGDDIITDYSGNDIYLYSLGDGHDTIDDLTGSEKIIFKDITLNMLKINDNKNNVEIKIDTYNSITISKSRTNFPTNSFELIFEDGTSYMLQNWNSSSWKIYKAACPITLQVYDKDNNLVASINDEQPGTQHYDFGMLYTIEENGELVKVAQIYDDAYKARILGTGNGVMNYSVTYLGTQGEIVRIDNYNNIPIKPNMDINTDQDCNLVIDENSDGTQENIIVPEIIKYDNVAPIITISPYNINPTNEDIIVTAITNEGKLNADQYTFTENGSFEFVATDIAGNVTKMVVEITNIDKTAPEITIEPYNTNPTNNDIMVIATTNEGTLDISSYTFSDNGSFEFVARDEAGNVSRKTVNIGNIDKIQPVISLVKPLDQEVFVLNQNVTAEWAVSDNSTGPITTDSSVPSGTLIDTKSVGIKVFTVTATDNAGNSTTVTATYKVVYGNLELQKLKENESNPFNAGSTVPIIFILQDANGNYIAYANAKIYYSQIIDGSAGEKKEAVSSGNANDGNLFRYDATNEQYIFNLSTKGWNSGTYLIKIILDDGTEYKITLTSKK